MLAIYTVTSVTKTGSMLYFTDFPVIGKKSVYFFFDVGNLGINGTA